MGTLILQKIIDFFFSEKVKLWFMVGTMMVGTLFLIWMVLVFQNLTARDLLAKLQPHQLYSIIMEAVSALKWIALGLLVIIIIGQIMLSGTSLMASGKLGTLNVGHDRTDLRDLPPNTTVTETASTSIEKKDVR